MKELHVVFIVILQFLKRIPRVIGEHAFLAFLLLVFLSLFVSGIIFFFITSSLKNMDPDTQISQTEFRKEMFLDILDIWEDRKARFERAGERKYENIFEIR